jgi:hypothetical protein
MLYVICSFPQIKFPLLRNKTKIFIAGKLKLKFYKGIAFASLKFSIEIYITIVDCLFQLQRNILRFVLNLNIDDIGVFIET